LIIAIIILLISFFNLSYLLIKNKKYTKQDKLIRFLIVFTSLLGLCTIIILILAINNTINQNFYILAFGLPKQYSYLFIFQWFFIVLTIMSLLYFVIKIKSISNTSVIFTILFSLILVCVYFQYWGFLL